MKAGKANIGLGNRRSGELLTNRVSSNTLFSDSKELNRSEYDSKDNYSGNHDGPDYGRSKRHSISSNYEDDFEDDDLDEGGRDNSRNKNRYK